MNWLGPYRQRSLSGTQPTLACGQSSSCCFSFSATRNAITKGNKYLTFGFSFVEGELFVSSWLAISNTGKNFLSYKLWCHTTISSPENSHNNTVKKYCIFSHAFTIVNPRLFVWIFLDYGKKKKIEKYVLPRESDV